jgi:hypothetical protein
VPVLPSDSERPAFNEKEALMPATSEAGGLTGLSMGEPSLMGQKNGAQVFEARHPAHTLKPSFASHVGAINPAA